MDTKFIGMFFIIIFIIGFFIIIQIARPDCNTGRFFECKYSKITPDEIRLNMINAFPSPIGLKDVKVMTIKKQTLDCETDMIAGWKSGEGRNIIIRCENLPATVGKKADFKLKLVYFEKDPEYPRTIDGYVQGKVEAE